MEPGDCLATPDYIVQGFCPRRYVVTYTHIFKGPLDYTQPYTTQYVQRSVKRVGTKYVYGVLAGMQGY
jgi:hypothetical protein